MQTPLGRPTGTGPVPALRAPTHPRCGDSAVPGLYRSATAPRPACCERCGTSGQWAKGLCKRCYEHSPHTVITRATGWAERMPAAPPWWSDFAAHLADHRHPIYAADVVATTARLIIATTSSDPRALLAHAHSNAPELVGALTDFFRTHGHLAPPPDLAERRAAARRTRRIEATPSPLRPQVDSFADFLLLQREQAQQLRAAPQPAEDHRDPPRHHPRPGPPPPPRGTQELGERHHRRPGILLALAPARRASHLAGMRRLLRPRPPLQDHPPQPADPITAVQQRGFHGHTLPPARQRILYERWATNQTIHPHTKPSSASPPSSTQQPSPSCASSPTPTSTPTTTASDSPADQCISHWTATWTALQRCQEHRSRLGTDNPHLLVTRLTRTHHGPAGAAHVRDSPFAPVGLLPRILRSTRLLALADELDPKILTVSLGMCYAGVTSYRPSPKLTRPV
ncbi:hypothetical protein SCANM63S_00034 [Streptomyces canarius]